MDKIVLVHLVTVVYNAGGATSRIGAKQSSFKVISTVKNSCSFQQQHEPAATAKLTTEMCRQRMELQDCQSCTYPESSRPRPLASRAGSALGHSGSTLNDLIKQLQSSSPSWLVGRGHWPGVLGQPQTTQAEVSTTL